MSPTRLSSVTIGIETLRANPLRTALSTLGIVVGSASLVAVLALGDGLQRYGRQQIEQTTDLQSVVLQPRTSVFIDGQVFPVDSYPVFGAAEAASLVAAIPGVRGASIALTGAAWLRGPGADSVEVGVVATLSSAADVLSFPMAAGRYFTEAE
ncbi:MAG: ABC transporter permease, partial [Gemmatimonadota bacterium]|nr:ABC transporter permease [Gemmatimonadota bacterium]